jgi:hypothetical protein
MFVMHSSDRFIANCNSWNDFWKRTKKLPTEGRDRDGDDASFLMTTASSPATGTDITRRLW